jgi:hypothetical protein
MKNKLLLTTALAGALVTGSAYAETKISGSMTVAINSASGTTALFSDSGFGYETQLDISNSGELNNGMTYSAGFSMETDGTGTSRAAGSLDAAENLRIIFTSGDTSIGFGQDFMPNMSATAAPKAGTMAGTAAGAVRASDTAGLLVYQNYPGDTFKNDFGVGLIQKVGDVGTFSALYVPHINDNGGADGEPGDLSKENGGYELTFKGNLGVEGLTFISGYKVADKDTAVTARADRDEKATQVGVGYNFGSVAAGITYNDLEEGINNQERQSTDMGVTFAANENLTLGLSLTQTDGKTAGTDYTGKEKITTIAAGYNLGPVAVVAQYADVNNGGGTSGSDGEQMSLRISTKF